MYFAKPVKQMNLCLQQSLFKCSKLSAGSEVSFNFVDFLKKSILHQYFQIFLKHFYLILPVHRLSLVAASRGYHSVLMPSFLTAWLQWLPQLLGMSSRVCSFSTVACGLSSCGTQAPRGQTSVPCAARQTRNHWTTRETHIQVLKHVICHEF